MPQPTLAELVNACPEPVRRLIHELEAMSDPASLVRNAIVERENALALAERVRELEAELRARG